MAEVAKTKEPKAPETAFERAREILGGARAWAEPRLREEFPQASWPYMYLPAVGGLTGGALSSLLTGGGFGQTLKRALLYGLLSSLGGYGYWRAFERGAPRPEGE